MLGLTIRILLLSYDVVIVDFILKQSFYNDDEEGGVPPLHHRSVYVNNETIKIDNIIKSNLLGIVLIS